jgi:hypothetical protein
VTNKDMIIISGDTGAKIHQASFMDEVQVRELEEEALIRDLAFRNLIAMKYLTSTAVLIGDHLYITLYIHKR